MAKIRAAGTVGLGLAQPRIGGGERGVLLNALNVVSKERGLLQPREPYNPAATGTPVTNPDRMFLDTVNMVPLMSSTSTAGLSYRNSTSDQWVSLDTTYKYCSHTTSRNTNFLLCDAGLRKINVANTATEIGGVPEALDLNIESLTGASGWFEYGTSGAQAAYRVVFGIKLSNSEFFLGAPSGRGVAIQDLGAATSRDVVIRFSVPAECTTSNFYQVYRTQPSSSSTTDPGDEMFLIYEDYLTSGNISDKYVEFTDRVPNGNGGAPLYTSPSQKGILQSNVQCEAAMGTHREGALASYAGCVWASSYRPRSNITINLLSVLTSTGLNARAITATTTSGSPTLTLVSSFTGIAAGMRLEGTGIPANTTILSFNSGAATITMSANATASAAGVAIVASDIITIAGVAYYAHTSETIADREFLVSTDSSAAKAVRLTAESLVRVINRNTTNTNHYAIYTSGPNDLPGRIYIFMRSTRNNSNTVQASAHGTAWSPNLTTAQTLESKEDQSIIVFSKPDEPHAYPYLNFIKLPENAVAVSMSVLRAALLIWTDKGLYRITGDYGNFSLDMMDESVRVEKPRLVFTVVRYYPAISTVVNNIAFCMTTRGIVAATESAATRISGETVNPYILGTTVPFCFSNPHDMFLYIPVASGGFTLVYNVADNIWTMIESGSIGFVAGVFVPGGSGGASGKMYFVQFAGTGAYYQNIMQYPLGFADFTNAASFSVTINTVTMPYITVASVPSYAKLGDAILSNSKYFTVTEINGTTIKLATEVSTDVPVTGAATWYDVVSCKITYAPVGSPDPALTKHYRYINVLFDGDGIFGVWTTPSLSGTPIYSNFTTLGSPPAAPRYISAGFTSDVQETSASTSCTNYVGNNPSLARLVIPQEHQRASLLNTTLTITSYFGFRLSGYEIDYETVGDKTRR